MKKIMYNKRSLNPHEYLDPIIDFLIEKGNSLSRDYRWGENRTGFFCFLTEEIDFDLIATEFELPSYVRLNKAENLIECDKTWASIKGGVPKVKQ